MFRCGRDILHLVVGNRLDPQRLTPPETIAKPVLLLADGLDIVDNKGQTTSADKAYRQAIVENAEFPDEAVARMIQETKVERQAGYGIEK